MAMRPASGEVTEGTQLDGWMGLTMMSACGGRARAPRPASPSFSHHIHIQDAPQPPEKDGVDRHLGRPRHPAPGGWPSAPVQVGRRAQLGLLLLGGRHAAAQGFAAHGRAGQNDELSVRRGERCARVRESRA